MYVLNEDEATTVVSRTNWKAVTSKQVEMDDCTKNLLLLCDNHFRVYRIAFNF